MWEKEKNQGLVKIRGGNSITIPINKPGVCIWQLRVAADFHGPLTKQTDLVELWCEQHFLQQYPLIMKS